MIGQLIRRAKEAYKNLCKHVLFPNGASVQYLEQLWRNTAETN